MQARRARSVLGSDPVVHGLVVVGVRADLRPGGREAAASTRLPRRAMSASRHSSPTLARNSPHYREAWRARPADAPLQALPIVTKRELMADFDRWVTDPKLTRAAVEDFLADRTHIGEKLLDRYAVWKSSGSSGEPGVFVQDDAALATYDALIGVQLGAARLGRRYASGVFGNGGKAALVTARDDHYASIVSWERLTRGSPWLSCKSYSVLDPLQDLATQLNAYQPAFVASYPTMLTLLAEERAAERLRISPALLWSGGECMTLAMRAAIERAFGCPVVNEYGASEALSIAYGCDEGWLHVNADWVVLEPVDAEHRPTPAGRAFAHGPAHESGEPRAADRALRPRRQHHREARALAPAATRCPRSRSRDGATTSSR